MLQELINANIKERSGMLWEAEHAVFYVSQEMDRIITQAICSTEHGSTYMIAKSDFTVLDEIFQELSAIRWNYHKKQHAKRQRIIAVGVTMMSDK